MKVSHAFWYIAQLPGEIDAPVEQRRQLFRRHLRVAGDARELADQIVEPVLHGPLGHREVRIRCRPRLLPDPFQIRLQLVLEALIDDFLEGVDHAPHRRLLIGRQRAHPHHAPRLRHPLELGIDASQVADRAVEVAIQRGEFRRRVELRQVARLDQRPQVEQRFLAVVMDDLGLVVVRRDGVGHGVEHGLNPVLRWSLGEAVEMALQFASGHCPRPPCW